MDSGVVTQSTGFTGIPVSLSLIGNGLFLVSLLSVIIIGFVLYYHWIRYGVGIVGTLFVMITYAVGTSVLLLAALGLSTQL